MTNHKYMVYTRDEGGRITREHRTVSVPEAGISQGYPHSEALAGWPESKVFWSTPYGLANGLAPVVKTAA